jgi:hypothetical protein
VPGVRLVAPPVHRAIVALAPPVIYTTNYDRNIERAFALAGRPHVAIVGASDAAAAEESGTQDVKLQGDLSDEASLVLTPSDYFDRLAFNGPLDIKLKADALGRAVLFVGYSMSDPNVRLMLYRLWRQWRRSGREGNRPGAWVLLPGVGPIGRAVHASWAIDVIEWDCEGPAEALPGFLTELARHTARARGAQDAFRDERLSTTRPHLAKALWISEKAGIAVRALPVSCRLRLANPGGHSRSAVGWSMPAGRAAGSSFANRGDRLSCPASSPSAPPNSGLSLGARAAPRSSSASSS